MGGLEDSNATDSNDNALVVIADTTTPTQRAGVTTASRLKVDALVSSISGGLVLTTSKKLRYDDMNASNGGVARGTLIVDAAASTTVYSYSGSGLVAGFYVNLEASASSSHKWQINFLVDGDEVFNSSGIVTTDLIDQTVYDLNTAGAREPALLGIEMVGNGVSFSTSPFFPIKYDSSVVIKVKKVSGGSRNFNAGLVILTKET